MDEYESLSHTTWDCKYHVVFIPKCRRKTLYQEPRRHLGEVFRKLALQKESKVEEGHLMPDHVHMLLSVPPKYAVSQVVGFIKGKSAIHLARVYGERKRNFVGQHFWGSGFFVNTVGRDEEAIRAYIRNQEKEDQRLRADEPLALIMPPSGGSKLNGPRQRPLLPLRAVHFLKPPALPGILTFSLTTNIGHLACSASRTRPEHGGVTKWQGTPGGRCLSARPWERSC
jgi:putative transposase